MERFATLISDQLSNVLSRKISSKELELPPDSKLGEFAFPCFKFAKEFRKAPPFIAKEMAEKIPKNNAFETSTSGPYINFRIPHDQLFPAILKDILSETPYGQVPSKTRSTWIIEASSPNVAKHLQIYHLRSTAHGAALYRIAKFRGFNAILINHLGDWGTQYGKLTIAYELFGSELKGRDPTISELVDFYVRFHQEEEKNPKLSDRAREAFRKLEQGDTEITQLWKKFKKISILEFQKTYQKLDVLFDEVRGESDYIQDIPKILDDLKTKKILIESEGAWIVPLEDQRGNELPPCLLIKKDGATLYATRDVAAAMYRYNKYKFKRMSYVVGGEQKLHFQQLFAVLKKAGHDWADRCEHIALGLYRFKGEKMSTRKGNFQTLEAVLSEAKKRAYELMKNRASTPKDINLDETAEAVSLGAVLFHDLSTDPAKNVDFDLDRVVTFEGETGPYLQYAHTRCLSILRKAVKEEILKEEKVSFQLDVLNLLKKDEELELIKQIGHFSTHLERTLEFSKASHLSNYLVDLTKIFNSFYRECRVLGVEPQLSIARLHLVDATRFILNKGLSLLGIPLPSRM